MADAEKKTKCEKLLEKEEKKREKRIMKEKSKQYDGGFTARCVALLLGFVLGVAGTIGGAAGAADCAGRRRSCAGRSPPCCGRSEDGRGRLYCGLGGGATVRLMERLIFPFSVPMTMTLTV